MQLSKKKIRKAYEYKDNVEEIYTMKKYILREELIKFGIDIDENSEIDTDTMREILLLVVKRITSKYNREDML